MEVYLDNSATTKVYDEVVQLTSKIMSEDYGNPSSMHQKGVDAEVYVKEAKERIAKTLKVQEKEIFFTSGGTESDNWALMGAASANSRAGRHLITTKIEHPAILQTMEYLESIGYEVIYLPVDEKGVLRLDALEQAIREEASCPGTTEDCLQRAAYYKKQDRFMDYVKLYHSLAGQGE